MPSLGVPCALLLQQVRFAQQATRIGGEAGVEKPFGVAFGRAVHHGRGQTVGARHVRLGAQIFKVDPNHRRVLGNACLHRFGQFAAEGFNHDFAQLGHVEAVLPVKHIDVVSALGCHPSQGRGVVHPQTHALAALGEVCAQAPTHAEVTVVVDDAAKHIPQASG